MNISRADFARAAAAQILADDDALARYETADLEVPADVAAVIDAALRRQRPNQHSSDDVTLLRANDPA